jgi:hypothetical protein
MPHRADGLASKMSDAGGGGVAKIVNIHGQRSVFSNRDPRDVAKVD